MNINKLFSAVLVLFAFSACTFIPEPPYQLPITNGDETITEEGVYIKEAFSSSLGVFSAIETVGSYPWVIDHSTAKATSYDSGTGQNNPATSWLISDPVDFTKETEAHASFDYIIRYSESGKVATNHQFLISSNYSGDPAAATWVDLPYNAVEGADWNTFFKADVAIPNEFIGKSGIVVAFRYTATSKSSTWEVKNFRLETGKPSNNGESEEPIDAVEYTIEQAIEAFANGKSEYAIIKGYIVGIVNGSYSSCIFNGKTDEVTNVLIATDANETDKTKCIPVQLPVGEIRNKVNLKDNPDNYRREVTFTGKLTSYFDVAGLKDVRSYVLGEVSAAPEIPNTPVLPEGNDIVLNGGFEDWNDSAPAYWTNSNTAGLATISKSTDAHEGNYSIQIDGASSSKRIYSQDYKLKAGTYSMVVYAKSTGEKKGCFRLAYGIKSGNTHQRKYDDVQTVTDEWTPRIYEFTLDKNTEVSLIIDNHSNGGGASILVDDVKLITTDGGIATE